MAETNKILTVSYGTFSCTLEGFDDAFGTMKAIAEYFRDLAADDRYFGAEPPQPDAEMLARIAQKEAARRVDARHDASGILLRASDTADAAPAMPSAAQVAAPIAQPAAEPAPAEPATAPGPDSLYSDEDSSVVAPSWGAPVEWEDDDIAEPEPVAAEPKRPAPVSTPAANHDMFADKLARIRAVVGNPRPIRPVAKDVGNGLADIATKDDTPFEDDLADAIADAQEFTAEESVEAFEDTAEKPVYDQATDPAYDLNVALPQVDDSTMIRTPIEAIAPLSEAEEDAADNLFDTVAAHDDTDDTMIHNILSDLDVDPAPAEDAAIMADDMPLIVQDAGQDIAEDAAEDDDEAPQPASIVRAVKVKRADLEQAIASGTLEEVTDEPASSLSEADEAELQAELEAVAAELAEAQATLNPPDEENENAANAPALPTPSVLTLGSDKAVPRATPAAKIEASKPDLSRLMAEANSKMDEPESSSRREAYAHLRAAVAAAEAEGSLGDGLTRNESDAAYREDLASVVRPRRPGSAEDPVRPRRPDRCRRADPFETGR